MKQRRGSRDSRFSSESVEEVLSLGKKVFPPHELIDVDAENVDIYRRRTFGAAHKNFLEEKKNWSNAKQRASDILESMFVELLLALVISVNSVLVIMETDLTAKKEQIPSWMASLSIAFLVFYCSELSLRMYVAGRFFFHSPSNVFDFIIVVSDVLSEVLSHLVTVELSFLRIFRLGRLLRFVAVLTMFEDLRHLIGLMIKSIWALAWGAFLIASLLICWSLLAVQFLHEWNVELFEAGMYNDSCTRCGRAFESVWASTLTFVQQLIFGDAWGSPSVVLIENHPVSAIILVGAGITIICGLLNLILTVIVDKAHEKHEQDAARLLKQKETLFFKAKASLTEICAELDTNKDGEISLDELMAGFENNSSFATIMSLMDITMNDVPSVFCMLDDDASGAISYAEFVDQIHKMRVADERTLLLFVKGHITEVRHRMNRQLVELRDMISCSTDRIGDISDRIDKLRRQHLPSTSQFTCEVDGLCKALEHDQWPMTQDSTSEIDSNKFGVPHGGENSVASQMENSCTSSVLTPRSTGPNFWTRMQATMRSEVHAMGSVLSQKLERDFVNLVNERNLGNGISFSDKAKVKDSEFGSSEDRQPLFTVANVDQSREALSDKHYGPLLPLYQDDVRTPCIKLL